MSTDKISVTNAIRFLRKHSISFKAILYKYEKSGTKAASTALNFPEHQIIKTLILKDTKESPFIVLMPGDLEVSTKSLARFLNLKSVELCTKAEAEKYTGYQTGGISPFGTKRGMPIFIEKTILEFDNIYINGVF